MIEAKINCRAGSHFIFYYIAILPERAQGCGSNQFTLSAPRYFQLSPSSIRVPPNPPLSASLLAAGGQSHLRWGASPAQGAGWLAVPSSVGQSMYRTQLGRLGEGWGYAAGRGSVTAAHFLELGWRPGVSSRFSGVMSTPLLDSSLSQHPSALLPSLMLNRKATCLTSLLDPPLGIPCQYRHI